MTEPRSKVCVKHGLLAYRHSYDLRLACFGAGLNPLPKFKPVPQDSPPQSRRRSSKR